MSILPLLHRRRLQSITPPSPLTIDPETYEQDEKARSFDITVDSDSNWTAVSSETWLTLSATSGSSGTSLITASLVVNDTGALRTAEITITNSDETKICSVNQNAVLQAPTNLFISIQENDINGDGSIDNYIGWDSVQGAVSYEVQIKVEGSWNSLGNIVSTNYFITGYQFQSGYTYYFRVKAFSETSESSWSAELSYTH